MEVGEIVWIVFACLFVLGGFIFIILISRDQDKRIKKVCKKVEIESYVKYSYEEFNKLFLNAAVNALARGDENTVKELIEKKQEVNEIYEYLKKVANL